MSRLRNLVIVLGDQLDMASPALRDFDPRQDRVWMAEAGDESRHVWSHRARIVLFLSAMRHFSAELQARGIPVIHHRLDQHDEPSLAALLSADISRLRPAALRVVQPGDWRVLQALEQAAKAMHIPLQILEDTHFFDTPRGFARWLAGRRQPRMEHYYRALRRRHRILMDGDRPVGGQWNFDADNRESFAATGPSDVPAPASFAPDATTLDVMRLVERVFPDHPGALDAFDWPVTRAQALEAMARFMDTALPAFGRYQDAMWTDQPLLYHSRLSAALNLKLLSPREVVNAAIESLREGRAPVAAVEGFVRQILGWREYVRGLYWQHMPRWLEWNALQAEEALPPFYWHGKVDMECLSQAIGQTLRLGYAHHIQRLMITGLFALLYGVQPEAVHAWYLAVYVDAVAWVEVPNTIGMSQFADGGIMASKPYIASGRYIQRMSNYCRSCRFRPDRRAGADACPFTVLYWDFLLRHRDRFAAHPRLALQVRNTRRLSQDAADAIQASARQVRDRYRP